MVFNSLQDEYDEDFNDFRGDGFDVNPSPSQLNSEKWRVEGLDDGDMNFGDNANTSVFARGEDDAGVTTGGVYAFEVATGDYSLGIQPTGSNFTSGNFTLRMDNQTGSTIQAIEVEYDIYYWEEADRSNYFNFRVSNDDSDYDDIENLDFETTQTNNPSWQKVERDTVIYCSYWEDDEYFYLQWQGDDVSGSGSRDQFALNNLEISPVNLDTMEVFQFEFDNFSKNWNGSTNGFSHYTDSELPETQYHGTGASTSEDYLGSNANEGDNVIYRSSQGIDQWKFSLGSADYGSSGPSSNNYFGVILMSDEPITTNDYENTDWNGYYLTIAKNSDYPEIHRVEDGISQEYYVFDNSVDLSTDGLRFGMEFLIRRDREGYFHLQYIHEQQEFECKRCVKDFNDGGKKQDTAFFEGEYFGVFTNFSNPSSDRRVYIDNIRVWNEEQEYTWDEGSQGDFVSSNFDPTPQEKHPSDRYIFDENGDVTLNGGFNDLVNNILVKDGTDLTIEPNQQDFYWRLGGGQSGNGLKIESNGELKLSGSEPVKIEVSELAEATIKGEVIFGDASYNQQEHKLYSQSKGGIRVIDQGTITANELNGNPFDVPDSEDFSVRLEDNAEYIHDAGSSPFNELKMTGNSTYINQRGTGPSISGRTYQDLKIDDKSSVTSSLGSDSLKIKGDLIVEQQNGSYEIDADLPVFIQGDVDGDFKYSGDQSLTLEGNNQQAIKGHEGFKIGPDATLEIDNDNDVMLEKNAQVNGELDFTAGNGRLISESSDDTVILGTSGEIKAEQNGAYVEGYLRVSREDVGQSNNTEGFGGIGVEFSDMQQDNGYITINRQSGLSTGADYKYDGEQPIDRVWEFDGSLNEDIDITFEWVSDDNNSKSFSSGQNANAEVWQNDDAQGSWQQIENDLDATDEEVTITNISSFSYYTVSDDISPLPVEWLYFNAEKSGTNKVTLNWGTGSERNNEGFEVLRSYNGEHWKKLDFVEGQGHSVLKEQYSYRDEHYHKPGQDYVFYKLKQVDYDGSAEVSSIEAVALESDGDHQIALYPNPAQKEVQLDISTQQPEAIEVNITDLAGKTVKQTIIQPDQRSQATSLRLDDLSPGKYMATFKGATFHEVREIIIQ